MNSRQDRARSVRYSAADVAYNRIHPQHVSSGDEQRYRRNKMTGGVSENVPSLIHSFTKGFQHDVNGFIEEPDDFEEFIRASDSGDIDIIAALHLAHKPVSWLCNIANTAKPGGADTRGWESMGTGQTFEIEGYDPQALAIPPAPKLWSHELAAEFVELYWMALIRDVPFSDFPTNTLVMDAVKHLNKLEWFKNRNELGLADYERKRKRGYFVTASHAYKEDNIFRANIKGDDIGYHISQFLYVGTHSQGKAPSEDGVDFDASQGYIQYGSIKINQRVRIAKPKKDYMTNWSQWSDIQNAADLRGLEVYGDVAGPPALENGYRFIWTPRDLATYVHYDALHEAYFNACIILLNVKAPFDPGIPFRGPDAIDKQIGFATFGGPHILTLVSEVAARALKAVRFQKYSVHRRARPEQVGGFIHQYKTNPSTDGIQCMQNLIHNMHADAPPSLFDNIKAYNATQNLDTDRSGDAGAADDSWLFPMPFVEGSPMHPSYGSGHATVAGACVTILKAFFDSGWVLPFSYKPSDHGNTLVPDHDFDGKYTIEGELNKLAANIAIGRNWGGVHWYSDQLESLRLGEQVALGILEEQKLTYGENFSMSIPLFDGTTIRI